MAVESEKNKLSLGGKKNPQEISLVEFEKEFEQDHPRFLRDLSEGYNSLTRRELLICTMIRSNMQEKTIGRLLDISPLTVENHRTNIRKKLGLTHTTKNLYNFLLKY
jgi:DNA-binding CsgD family transcriptional regulator